MIKLFNKKLKHRQETRDNILNNNHMEDNIRQPDPTKVERLINNSFDNYSEEDALLKILELSKCEFDNNQEIYEKESIQLIIQESQERLNKFENIKQKLNKILSFDKKNAHIYETILTAIQFYIEGYITEYKTTKEEYEQIFQALKTIRLTNDEFTKLQNLIVNKE
jgi:hypothetical protein